MGKTLTQKFYDTTRQAGNPALPGVTHVVSMINNYLTNGSIFEPNKGEFGAIQLPR